MKDKMANPIVLLFLLLVGFLLFNNCGGTRTGPTEVIPGAPVVVAQTSPLILAGTVRDASNLNAIAGANVLLNKVDGTAITVISTDNNGRYAYDVTNLNLSQVVIHALANSYGSSSATAKINVTNYTTTVPPIYLTQVISTSQNIVAISGGQVGTNSVESISAKNIGVQIPAGALSQNISITVSSLTCNNVSSLGTSNTLLAVAGSFGPSGTTFSSPVTVSLPLPYLSTPGKLLPLNLLNTSTLVWTNIGSATVDADGKSASFQTSHFSTYGVSDVGSFTASNTSTSNDGASFLLSAGGSQTYTFTPSVTFTTTNPNLSNVWIFNTLANDAVVSLYGLRVYDGALLPVTISTPDVIAPALPSNYQKTVSGVVYYTNPDLPTQNGTWSWKGVYQKVDVTISGTITLGDQSENLNVLVEQYVKVSDQWTWTQAHDQGTVTQ